MIAAVLLLAIWPFHHKKPHNSEAWESAVAKSRQIEQACAVQDGLWFYLGDDDFIGIGPSCEAAHHNWSIMHVDPVRMSNT